MTDEDTQLLAGVLNRMGASELTHVLQKILERLEALEPKPEAEEKRESPLEGEAVQAPGADESSSSPNPEPVTQTQTQSY